MSGHIILCGLGHVGFRILEQLLQLKQQVTVVTLPDPTTFIQMARERQVKVIEGNILDQNLMLSAGLKSASCLILATDNDEVNLQAALHVKEIRPDLPIVLRVFDHHLAQRLERAFGIRRVFSTAAVAAPSFAAAALDPEAIGAFRLGACLITLRRVRLKEKIDWIGKAVQQLREDQMVIPLVRRRGQSNFKSLSLDAVLHADDELILAALWKG